MVTIMSDGAICSRQLMRTPASERSTPTTRVEGVMPRRRSPIENDDAVGDWVIVGRAT